MVVDFLEEMVQNKIISMVNFSQQDYNLFCLYITNQFNDNFKLFFFLNVPGYAMVSTALPDLQLVSLSCVFGLSSLCSTAEVAVILLLGSAP